MKHEYWVYFPQGIVVNHKDNSKTFKRMEIAHSLTECEQMMNQENPAAYFEKIQYKQGRRFCVATFTRPEHENISLDDLFDLWCSKFEEIVITE